VAVEGLKHEFKMIIFFSGLMPIYHIEFHQMWEEAHKNFKRSILRSSLTSGTVVLLKA
jgi:hypothetical protein